MMSQTEFNEAFTSCLKENGLAEYTGLSGRMYLLTELLLQYNAHTNLTAIRRPADIIAKHLADSLAVCRLIPMNASVLDVGAGAGFPSLPIAAARPDVSVTALDSTLKKLAFIDEAASSLQIANITTLNRRAESAAHEAAFRERFTIVTARAVARLNVLSELCLPFTAVGGVFIAMKGAEGILEIREAENAVRILGGTRIEKSEGFLIADGQKQKRCTVIIRKTGTTPKNYPRQFSQINKKPL